MVGRCVACFVLNGWLCGVSVLLCSFLALMVLCFCLCVFRTAANALKCLFCSLLAFFLFCWFFILVFALFCCFGIFFRKVLGQVGPEGPPHLNLNLPGLLLFFALFVFLVLEGLGSGEVGPPHLALTLPRLFVSFFCLLLFCLLCFFCYILFLWVGFHLLFWFPACEQKRCFFPAILVSFGVMLVQTMFSNSVLGSWVLMCS